VPQPDNAGKLMLDDPRGPLPPFTSRYTVEPEEGLMVLFPSWLTHQVTPTLGNDARVSWSFNILDGDWAHTSTIMVECD
jgi:hypothetical protein